MKKPEVINVETKGDWVITTTLDHNGRECTALNLTTEAYARDLNEKTKKPGINGKMRRAKLWMSILRCLNIEKMLRVSILIGGYGELTL